MNRMISWGRSDQGRGPSVQHWAQEEVMELDLQGLE